MLDDGLLADWCLSHLGAPLDRVLFRSGFLSEVIGVELSGGLRAVVKARPFQPRIAGCVQVQAALADVGFPCPKPLTGATRVHGMTVTAETEEPGGSPLSAEAGAAPFAALLARLVSAAPSPASVASLVPSPPWAGWDHPGRRLWPDLDEHGQDLNLVAVPEWVEDAARRVRERLTSAPGRLCIGHGDWASQNIRWTGHDPLVVHDWDSVIAQPEAAIVGLAAAMWPSEVGSDDTASVAQTDEFITSYQLEAGREWAVARFGMPGRRVCGIGSCTSSRTRPRAVVSNMTASPARSTSAWIALPSRSPRHVCAKPGAGLPRQARGTQYLGTPQRAPRTGQGR